eukprot:6263838-Prymnesium_polylepis.1
MGRGRQSGWGRLRGGWAQRLEAQGSWAQLRGGREGPAELLFPGAGACGSRRAARRVRRHTRRSSGRSRCQQRRWKGARRRRATPG